MTAFCLVDEDFFEWSTDFSNTFLPASSYWTSWRMRRAVLLVGSLASDKEPSVRKAGSSIDWYSLECT